MSRKYHIDVETLPSLYEPIPEFCAVEISPCLRCTRCVKDSACVYGINDIRKFDTVQAVDAGDVECVSCMRCIQECKANILTRVRNSRYDAIGNDYWRPALIRSIGKQAETGAIPVSGAGYRGPFSGPGFDRMWTDMSEIVRPTRDGIHGREYISTVIDLGGRPDKLMFDDSGNLLTPPPLGHELPLPVILDTPALGINCDNVKHAVARAALKLGTIALADITDATGLLSEYTDNLIVALDPADAGSIDIQSSLAQIAYCDNAAEIIAAIKKKRPDIIVSVRLPLDENAADRASMLAADNIEIIHLQATADGRGTGKNSGRFVTDLVREVHLRLVADGRRDRLTLLASGGIAMAEHIAKLILCGVDGVGVDTALAVAMECRVCADCGQDTSCPVNLATVPVEYGAQRIVNMIGSWHAQFIELMGAMGIREARRLRGEVGRAMFFDEMEKDSFSPLFGERRAAADNGANDSNPEISRGEVWNYLPPEDLAADPVADCPSRFRNRLTRYKVIRTGDCIACGRCVEACTFDVLKAGTGRMPLPLNHLCAGPETCRSIGSCCTDVCPTGAIRVGDDPLWETFGDSRWPADLIVSTWEQAETGKPPAGNLEYRTGNSGGGFDRIDFAFPDEPPDKSLKQTDVELAIPLNRRGDNRPQVEIGLPVYGGGMSYGSVSMNTLVARARAWTSFNSFTCTGEGGFPDALIPYSDNIITQIATGLFGISEETIKRVRMVEFKYAQGAKPGLGGHLLGDKNTEDVARMREAVKGTSLFSPFPFHSVYSIEDHRKHVDWIKIINPIALVSAKVSTPNDVDMVAVGSYYAGAHIVHIDGSYGGTGAAPDIAKKNIAMPLEYAIPRVHRFLTAEGIRDRITLIASGGIRSAWDIAKAIALGADGVVLGTSELVALECVRCGKCESGRGCPRGIATTDPQLSQMYSTAWATQRLVNMLHSYAAQLQYILWRFGMRNVNELAGRTDLLRHRDYTNDAGKA
jgi:glutamate synthase domain-containing protein 2/NAD-dependent dihydropyrimidine dehydrogenase PreA subunit